MEIRLSIIRCTWRNDAGRDAGQTRGTCLRIRIDVMDSRSDTFQIEEELKETAGEAGGLSDA